MYEASCRKCGQTFIPDGADDMEHIQRDDETPCGGEGDLVGTWSAKELRKDYDALEARHAGMI